MFLELIRKRRSIRKYLKKSIETEKIKILTEAALRAPSSRSLNPWSFIVVDRPELMKKLALARKHGSAHLKDAPLGIVVCADPGRCDVWIEDAAIAATYIQLAAESIGLGNCWVQIRERSHDGVKTAEEYVREVLKIPGRLKVESIIAIGYPDQHLPPHDFEELETEKVHFNSYQTD